MNLGQVTGVLSGSPGTEDARGAMVRAAEHPEWAGALWPYAARWATVTGTQLSMVTGWSSDPRAQQWYNLYRKFVWVDEPHIHLLDILPSVSIPAAPRGVYDDLAEYVPTEGTWSEWLTAVTTELDAGDEDMLLATEAQARVVGGINSSWVDATHLRDREPGFAAIFARLVGRMTTVEHLKAVVTMLREMRGAEAVWFTARSLRSVPKLMDFEFVSRVVDANAPLMARMMPLAVVDRSVATLLREGLQTQKAVLTTAGGEAEVRVIDRYLNR